MKNVRMIRRQKMPDKQKFFPQISPKTRKAFYLEVSKYFMDLTKLIFGGIILTNILSFNINKTAIFVLGILAISIFIGLSLIFF